MGSTMGGTSNHPCSPHLSSNNFISIQFGFCKYLKHTRQVSYYLPTAPRVLQAPPMLVPLVGAPNMCAVKVTTQTPATNLRIDQLIEVVAAMKANIEKENTVSDIMKLLRPLADKVHDEVLSAKYKMLNSPSLMVSPSLR